MRDHYPLRGSTKHGLSLWFNQFISETTNNPPRYAPEDDTLDAQIDAPRVALVVDDVADVTDMLSVLLTHAGYEVVTAASAPQALKAASKRKFDIIISDIGMPEMNGYQLAREMRLLPGYENIPMVAVTGYSMFDDRKRSASAGFNAHMTKPIDPRALLDLIEQL
jgi:CheY-like chemotaxis protein